MLAAAVLALAAATAPARPFAPGEELSYEVRLLGVRAGEAAIRVEADGDPERLKLMARGQSVGATEALFGVRQSASCLVARDDLAPSRCRFRSKRRGGERLRELTFDRSTGSVEERILEKGRPRSTRAAVGAGETVQEALSGLYLLRERLPGEGETVRFRSLRKGKPITVEATRVATRAVKTPAGAFRAAELALRVLEPQGKEETSAGTLFISDDAARLPVKLSLDAPVGTLEAALSKVAGR